MIRYMLVIIVVLISCKKNEYKEVKQLGGNIIEVNYKNNKINYSKTINKSTKKTTQEFYYNEKGLTTLGKEFYNNGNIKNVLRLDKKPNHYLETGYYPNEIKQFEGGVNLINKKKYRSGSWVFYNEDGTVYSTVVFGSDDNGNEWVIEEKKVPQGYKIRYKNGDFINEE